MTETSASTHGTERGARGSTATWSLALGAVGIVFGDIGTSPIYAFRETLAVAGTDRESILGALSLIFWALTLVVLVKYLSLVMRANNDGEGGILALLALLPETYRKTQGGRKGLLFLAIMAGTALLFGDGALTPAISVLSATEGIAVINEDISHYAVPMTVAILVMLFAVQPRGTHRIGRVFGPIMVGWFLVIGAFGAYRVVQEPGVLAALSPTYAVSFLSSHITTALAIGAVVILAITGGEALYADMGHFGLKPIRRAWLMLAMPALTLAYLGQAALVLADPEKLDSAFFSLAPNKAGALLLVVMATLATVIASQALITGAFSLARQAVQLGLLPRLQVRHTSEAHEGQIFVPLVNWLLAPASIALVIGFGSSSAIAGAYGLVIAGLMTVTSVAFFVVVRSRWGWSRAKAVPVLVLLLTVDGYFLASTLGKFFHGGWVPVLIGLAILSIMLLWRRGNRLLTEHSLRTSMSWEEVGDLLESGAVHRTDTEAVMLFSNPNRAPHALSSTLSLLKALPADLTVLSVETQPHPFVADDDRLVVTHLRGGVRKVVLKVGFAETPDVPRMLEPLEGNPERRTYFLSDRTFNASDEGAMGRTSESLFAFLYRNAAKPAIALGLPDDRVVTVSTHVDL